MSLDRLNAAFGSLLNLFLGRQAVKEVDACACYWGTVAKVNGAKVDVTLDSKDIASPSNVVLSLGLPGCSIAGIEGTRVLIGFRDGDLSKPYAAGFDSASAASTILVEASSYVAVNGTAHPMPKFDTFESALSSFLSTLSTQLALGTSGTPAAQQLVGIAAIQTAITNLTTALGNGTYDSAKAKNG